MWYNKRYLFTLFFFFFQVKEGVATQAELDAIKASVLESYEKDFEVK